MEIGFTFNLGSKKKQADVSEKGMVSDWTTVSNMGIFGGASGGRQKINSKQLKAMYRGWVFACVNVRGKAVGNIELELYKTKKNGQDEEIFEHEILNRLYSMNETATKRGSFALVSKHLDIYGKAFWYYDKNKKRIINRHPDKMSAVYDEDGMIVSWVYTYYFKGKQNTITYKTEDIIYFKEEDPLEDNKTQSLVEGGFEWIEAEINATDWNRVFFKNNAIPPYLIETPIAMNGDMTDRLKASFAQEHGGIQNAHRTGILPVGSKIHELSNGHKDMDFAVLDERFQDKICGIFQVPKTVLGISKDVNRSSSESANYSFQLWAVKPQMELIVDTLNEYFVPLFVGNGENVYLDFKSPVPEDRAGEREEIKVGLAGQPYKTVNEVREEEGLLPVDGGDEVRIITPANTNQNPDSAPTDTGKGMKLKKKTVTKVKPRKFTGHRQEKKDMVATASEKITNNLTELLKNIDFDAVAHKNFVSRVEPYVEKNKKSVLAVNDAFRKSVNENFEKLVKNEKSLAENEEEVLALMVKLVSPNMTEVAKKEGQAIYNGLKISEPFKVSEELQRTLDKKVRLMASSYDATTRDMISKTIAEGLEGQLSIDEIKNLVNERVFDFSDSYRAGMIADTETFRIANIGIRDAYESSSVVSTVRWYSAEDGEVCEFCDAMDGTIVDVKETFLDKGDTLAGTKGGVFNVDYDSVYGGALHPHCRCYVRAEDIVV